MIIGFAGRARHGKDYSAAYAARILCAKGADVQIQGFANELKNRVTKMLHDIENIEDLRETKPPWLRRLYQAVGENVRNHDPNFWVDRLIEEYQYDHELSGRIWLVPDVRYGNEIDAIKQQGGKVIKLVRENEDGSPYRCAGTDPNHPSEAEIDTIPDRKFDAIIHAKTGMTRWIEQAVEMNLERWGLL